MKATRTIAVLALAVTALCFAASPKPASVKGRGIITADTFKSTLYSEVKGPEKGKPARGDFEMLATDADGNLAEFELRKVTSIAISGKSAIIKGLATMEVQGQFEDDSDDDDDNGGLEDMKLVGPVTILVADRGNGKAGSTPDHVTLSFDDPDTDGIDFAFDENLAAGNLTVSAGTSTNNGGKKK